jgi:hypothetical protein
MSEPLTTRMALRVAFRHFTAADTTDAEREAILHAVINSVGGEEGELAARMLHHRREAEDLQMKLSLRIGARTAA